MGYISDNGGEDYNLCHCRLPTHPYSPSDHPSTWLLQSGPISKSQIWTSGAPPHTPLMLTTWKLRVVSTMRFVQVHYLRRRVFTWHAIISGGAMRRSTALEPLYSHAKTKSTSSTKSATSTHLTSTALERRNHGRMEGAAVIPVVALVSPPAFSLESVTNRAVRH